MIEKSISKYIYRINASLKKSITSDFLPKFACSLNCFSRPYYSKVLRNSICSITINDPM